MTKLNPCSLNVFPLIKAIIMIKSEKPMDRQEIRMINMNVWKGGPSNWPSENISGKEWVRMAGIRTDSTDIYLNKFSGNSFFSKYW